MSKIFRTYGAHSAAAGASDSLLDIVAGGVLTGNEDYTADADARSDEILPLTEAKHDMARPRHRHHAKGHPTMLGSMQHTLDTKNG